MKIYTRTGDEGETSLFGGPRAPKHHLRIEAYGDVDELNSTIGAVRAEELPADIDSVLNRIQHELFSLGAGLATPDPTRRDASLTSAAGIEALEAAIDTFDARLAPLREFILPGGTRAAAAMHLARCVCRRAERRVTELRHTPDEDIEPLTLIYLNRLSDLLFVLARAVNSGAGVTETAWKKPEQQAGGLP